jgi:hypothetical protein
MNKSLTEPAKDLARKLAMAWVAGTVDQIFRVSFEFQDRGVAAGYGYGLDTESADALGLRLGALRELQHQNLILMNESEYDSDTSLEHGKTDVQVTLLQALAYAVDVEFNLQS